MIDLFDKTLFLFAADMEFDAAMDNKNNSYNTAICGVGLVNSAIGTAKAIQQKILRRLSLLVHVEATIKILFKNMIL